MADNAPPSGPPSGPPYAPTTAALGGLPTTNLDVPICAVFLVLFATGAISHMTILQLNLRRGHKFIISGLVFGFCMARISACALRIAWAVHPTNVSLAIAAGVFVAAGVVLLFVVNLVFAQRILRALHPHSGWHPFFHFLFLALYAVIVLSVIMVIIATVDSFYTLDGNTHRIDRDVQLTAQTIFAVMAFLPIAFVTGSYLAPRRTHVEKFGRGRFRSKLAILLASATILCLGASFRAGTNYLPLRPASDPAWYHSKACFYLFNFTIDITVVLFYVVVRIDRRFHIPNGSKGPGDYGRDHHAVNSGSATAERGDKRQPHGIRIMSEEEVFDDQPADGEAAREADKAEEATNGGFIHS